MPHLQQGARILGKKALQTGVNVAQDVLAGENVKTATKKRAKLALSLPSQNSSQSGGGRKAIKRKTPGTEISSPPGKRAKASPQQKKKPEDKFSKSKMAFVHHESQECTKSELDLFTINSGYSNIYHQGAMDRIPPPQ